MPEPRRTIGIFGDDTDPNTDADVIMTAAIVGYAQKRLVTDKKVCAFAAAVLKTSSTLPILRISEKIKNYKEWLEKEVEPKVKSYSSQVSTISKDEIDFTKGGILLANAIDRVNLALGIGPQQEGPRVELDATPNYGEGGIIWIVGGTGDLGLDNANRYVNSPDRSQKLRCGLITLGAMTSSDIKGQAPTLECPHGRMASPISTAHFGDIHPMPPAKDGFQPTLSSWASKSRTTRVPMES